jgi:thiol-disulfide isomerase/thioredoxin
MKRFQITFFACFSLISFNVFAQTGYRIEGTVRGLGKDAECILANYMGVSLYPKDTAKADATGRMVFENKQPLPQGVYNLVLPDRKTLIRLIIAEDQTFSFTADTSDVIGLTKIKGSRDNEFFYDYWQYMTAKDKEADKISKEKTVDKDKKLKSLGDERRAYHEKMMKDYADTFAAKLFKTSADPEIPPAPKLANGRIDSTWQLYYYKRHYFDNLDFKDERMLRTPFLSQKINTYLQELTVQTEDSLNKAADEVVKLALQGKQQDVIDYTIWFITNQYESAKVVGTEGVFVHMAKEYYLKGLITVNDSSTIKSMKERSATLEPLLVGRVIPDLGVQNEKGGLTFIHANPAIFKVVMFYAPSCGHCRESAPKLKAFYEKNKLRGVEVMTISTQDNEEDWKKFIKEYKWETLINGFGLVADRKVEYRKDFDVSSTPTTYIIDENRKIIARRLPIEDLEPFLNVYLEKRKREKAQK